MTKESVRGSFKDLVEHIGLEGIEIIMSPHRLEGRKTRRESSRDWRGFIYESSGQIKSMGSGHIT